MNPAADVVVVGAGIVGCSAAYHLAAAGAGHVVVLEREEAVGRGATGACAGGFRHQFTSEVNIRLSQASVPMILGFEAEHRIPVDISQDGYLFLVRDAATWTGFERAVALQRSLGVEVDVLDRDGVSQLVPGLAVDELVGATYGPRDGIADPGALTQGYETLARGTGVEFRLASTVERLALGSGGVTGVRVDGQDLPAGALLLAAGPWSGTLAATAGIDLPIQPVPRVVLTTGAFPGIPRRRTLVIDADSSFYFHREGDGVLMGMGGDDLPSFDTSVDEAFVTDDLLPRAVTVFPPLAEAGIRSRWSGLYEMTPDRHPVVGPGPVEGLWIAAGFSGHGFQHGPVVGKLMAELMLGRSPSVDVSSLSFDRFARRDLVTEGQVV